MPDTRKADSPNPAPTAQPTRGEILVAHIRAHATPGGMTTEEIMALTRGDPDEDPPPT